MVTWSNQFVRGGSLLDTQCSGAERFVHTDSKCVALFSIYQRREGNVYDHDEVDVPAASAASRI